MGQGTFLPHLSAKYPVFTPKMPGQCQDFCPASAYISPRQYVIALALPRCAHLVRAEVAGDADMAAAPSRPDNTWWG